MYLLKLCSTFSRTLLAALAWRQHESCLAMRPCRPLFPIACVGCDALVIATSAVPEIIFWSLIPVMIAKLFKKEGVRCVGTWLVKLRGFLLWLATGHTTRIATCLVHGLHALRNSDGQAQTFVKHAANAAQQYSMASWCMLRAICLAMHMCASIPGHSFAGRRARRLSRWTGWGRRCRSMLPRLLESSRCALGGAVVGVQG